MLLKKIKQQHRNMFEGILGKSLEMINRNFKNIAGQRKSPKGMVFHHQLEEGIFKLEHKAYFMPSI